MAHTHRQEPARRHRRPRRLTRRHNVYPGPAVYMPKLVVAGHLAADLDLDAPIAHALTKITTATDQVQYRSLSIAVTTPAPYEEI